MKRLAPFSILLLAAACASTQPPAGPSPVKVVVTAEPSVSRYLKSEKLAEVTEEAMRKYAAASPPATLTLHFVDIVSDTAAIDQRATAQRGADGRSLPIVSSEPWNEPGPVTSGSSRPAEVSMPHTATRPVLRAVYTIADANGTVLEKKAIFLPLDYGDGYSNRTNEQRMTAAYLARRVAELTKNHG